MFCHDLIKLLEVVFSTVFCYNQKIYSKFKLTDIKINKRQPIHPLNSSHSYNFIKLMKASIIPKFEQNLMYIMNFSTI